MNKIGNLLKEHANLRMELMADEAFVEEAKKIFAESGLEFSTDMLKSILEDTESNLREVQNLPDDKLIDVVGGVDFAGSSGLATKKERTKGQKAASIAIKVTATLVGTVLGGGIGLFLGSDWHWKRGEGITSGDLKPLGAVIGAGTGNVLGYRLGALISKKLGYEEEEELLAIQPAQ